MTGLIPLSAFETVTAALDAHVLTLTLNRPERRNALNRRAYAEIESAFRHASENGDVRCVILTGAGQAFCSGEDVKEMMTGPEREASAARLASNPVTTPAAAAMLECAVPVIAAVNGPAVGWGLEMTLYADMRLASALAAFSSVFVKRGLVTDVGGFTRLPALVGPAEAARLLFTGESIGAARALEIGLVNEVTAHDALLPRARELANAIAANPPLAVRALKAGLTQFAAIPHGPVGQFVGRELARLFQTADHREGVQSFLEKRAPVFTGR